MRTPAARSTSGAKPPRPVAARTLVTGFLGFGKFPVNPSALLAESSSRPCELIEVAYDAVDKFVGTLEPNIFDCLLMLGVAGQSSQMRLECVARNRIGPLPMCAGSPRVRPGPRLIRTDPRSFVARYGIAAPP